MFGFTIIREEDLTLLRRKLKRSEEAAQKAADRIGRLESDCNSLRHQNGNLRMQLNRLKDKSLKPRNKNNKPK